MEGPREEEKLPIRSADQDLLKILQISIKGDEEDKEESSAFEKSYEYRTED